jgi:phospholipid/cholesterol/gamma-HCH transport system substrate-binding protein
MSEKGQTAETLIGAVVIAVAVCFLGFAVTRAGEAGASGGYTVFGRFDRVDGIGVGADVRVSGVKVGAVSRVSIDPQTYYARLDMTVTPSVKLPDDSSAKVASDGLLGGAYIALDPGGSETMLASGGEILNTQGAIDLISTFAALAKGGGSESEKEEATP